MAEPDSSSDSSSGSEEEEQPKPLPDVGFSSARSVASSTGAVLRVCFVTRKARVCILCNCKSTDESPLEYSEDVFPEANGRVPWRSHEKTRDEEGEMVKVPSGKLCLICFNVYRALGAVIAVVSSHFFAWILVKKFRH